MDFDDETLMAYADRALPDELASRVAAAAAADPGIAARIGQLRAARTAVAALPLPPAPPGLAALIRARAAIPAQAQGAAAGGTVIPLRRRIRPALWQIPLTAAASLVAGVLLAPLLMPAPAGGLPSGLVRALDSQPAGAAQGGTRIVASFTDGAGTLCREYETESRTGIACREDGEWQLRLLVASGGAGGYAPASSLEVIDAWMMQNDAAPPLSPEAEAGALRRR